MESATFSAHIPPDDYDYSELHDQVQLVFFSDLRVGFYADYQYLSMVGKGLHLCAGVACMLSLITEY